MCRCAPPFYIIESFKKHTPPAPGQDPAHYAAKSKRRPTGLPLFELAKIREEDLKRISWEEAVENLIKSNGETGTTKEADTNNNNTITGGGGGGWGYKVRFRLCYAAVVYI